VPSPPAQREQRRPLLGAGLALAGASACWGLGTVATKALLADVPPLPLLAVQLVASVAFLWLAVAITRPPLRLDRSSALAALSGLFEPGLAYTVGMAGLRLTSASNATLIGAAETPLTVLLAAVFLRERIGGRALLLVAAAAGGVVLLSLPHAAGLGGGSVLGDGLVAVGALLAAGYVTVSRRLIGGFSPLPLAALQQGVGLLWVLAVLAVLPASELTAPVRLPLPTLLQAAATGVVMYALSFWLYLSGLRRVSASRAALFLALIPVFGVAGAALALGERLTPLQWVGAAVVVGAVQGVVRAERRATGGS
jgi:drug/metabolite transporter (DMT)-like permease